MESISLSEIDWNNLNESEFLQIQEKLNSLKIKNPRKKRIENYEKKLVKIYNKQYMLPVALAERLYLMKSEQPKKKLIEHILINYKPLEIVEI